MNQQKRCAICHARIEGGPFALSDLKEPPGIIQVCERCAAGGDIVLEMDGVDVELDRDEYLQCAPEELEELEQALGEAYSALEDRGWRLQGLLLRKKGGRHAW